MLPIIESAIITIAKRLGLTLVRKPNISDNYSYNDKISLTGVIANKVTTITVSDSSINVKGYNPRAEYLNRFVNNILSNKLSVACEVALGTGDCIIKPFADGTNIGLNIIRNEHFYVAECVGDYIKSCIIKCDEITKSNGTKIERFETQRIRKVYDNNNNLIDVLFIYQQAFVNGREVPIETIPEWSNIKPMMYIPNCSNMLFGRIKCPTVNRDDVNGVNGVPITYGLDDVMNKAVESYYRMNREFESKEPMIFADKTVFTKDKVTGKYTLPKCNNENKNTFMLLNGGSDGSNIDNIIKTYSPDIRSSSMSDCINENFKMVELLCGLSNGILTAPTTSFSTATEMKASLSSSYAYCSRFRKNIEYGVNGLIYAVNILCNYYNITPMGDYTVEYDWSTSYIENIDEQFKRLMEAQKIGAVSKAEIRAWLFDKPVDDAKLDLLEEGNA